MSGHGARRWTLAALAGIGVAVAASAGLALADPPAGFTVSAERPVPGETVTFTAQDACAPPVDCAWDFGDGAGASGREVAHAFAAAGPQTVTLTVSDPGDPADPSVATAVVRVDARPTAAFSVDPASPRRHDTVTFDGRASSDPDGDGLAYRWDFDGDGAAGRRGRGDHPLLSRRGHLPGHAHGRRRPARARGLRHGDGALHAAVGRDHTLLRDPADRAVRDVHGDGHGSRRSDRRVGVGPRRRRSVRRRLHPRRRGDVRHARARAPSACG